MSAAQQPMGADAAAAANGDNASTGSSPSSDEGKRYARFASVDAEGPLSRFFFWWFWAVLRAGYRAQIVFAQLAPTARADNPERLYAEFQRFWDDEEAHADAANAKAKAREEAAPAEGVQQVRILRVMLRVIGYPLLAGAFCLSAVQMGLSAMTPFLSKWLIESLSEPEQTSAAKREQIYYAVGIVLLPLLASLCQARVMYVSRRASQHLFTVFTQSIFNKALRLSSASRNESSSGQIVNLMSTDAGTSMERAVLMIYPLFLAPPLIAVLLYLLYQELGVSAYAGLACILVATPVNLFIFVSIMRVYQRIIAVTDERVKLVNEAIGAIRVLKLYAWELPFMRKIAALREKELVLLKTHGLFFSIGLNAVFLQLPYLIQFFAFTTYYLLDNSFLPWIIFTAIQLLQVLQQALTQLPSAITTLTQAVVAARRIKRFLLLPELKQSPGDVVLLRDADPDGAAAARGLACGEVRVDAASFRWDLLDTSALAVAKRGAKKAAKSETEEAGGSLRTASLAAAGGPAAGGPAAGGPAAAAAAAAGDGAGEDGPGRGDEGVILRDIALRVRPGAQCAVIGKVGSGKSSLLAAIVGELETVSGSVAVFGSVAYAPQQPWIVSATVRDNILFGRAMDADRYREVLHACCLETDLELFADGDEQFVGERGVSLSGGQKARISLARAVYADARIVLLDDPLSAVDAHVGKDIFERCIMGRLLRGKTLVWVTNQVDRLHAVDHVVLLERGAVKAQGRYADVAAHANLAAEVEPAARAADELDEARAGSGGGVETARSAGRGSLAGETAVEDMVRLASAISTTSEDGDRGTGVERSNKLYEAEEEAVGTLKLSVLGYYVSSAGVALFTSAYGIYWLYLFTPLFGQYILTFWTNEVLCVYIGAGGCDTDRGDSGWYALYAMMLCLGMALVLTAGVLIAFARVATSRTIHEGLLRSTFEAGITDFFDVQPMGRILNRFSRDISQIDVPLNQMLMFGVATIGFTCAGFLGIILGTNGLFAIMILPILVLYVFVYRYTRTTAIQLQRLEATARSPIYSGFAEVLNGLKTVRAFQQQERFVRKNRAAVERNIRAYYLVRVVLPAWLMLTVNLIGVLISSAVCAFVLASNAIDPSQAGLALTYAISITQTLNATTMVNTEVEVMMNSVERIKKYIDDNKSEDPLRARRRGGGDASDASDASGSGGELEDVEAGGAKASPPPERKVAAVSAPSGLAVAGDAATEEVWEAEAAARAGADAEWPVDGRIEFRDLVVGYRRGPDVLHGVSFVLEPGAKVGVCGRTGSGKTTLTAALLRIVEARSGSIMIDGVDIAQLPLHTLRSRIAIIPQDPVCFVGSIRFNLDPFGEYGDAELQDCLRKVQLHQFVDDLDFQVAEGGENISVGQRQMVCFGRAILRKTRVLIMDEATANVDNETDRLLQEMVTTVFADRTSITIAHRLRTILQSTHIVVLDHGQLAEFDSPENLMADQSSIFAQMVQAERNEARQR